MPVLQQVLLDENLKCLRVYDWRKKKVDAEIHEYEKI